MATTTNYGWAEPDNTSLVRNGAQDIRILGDAIDASVWNIGFGQAGKNKIINGDFGIWQRGTSFSGTGYTADRFNDFSSGGTLSTTRQTFTPGTAPVAGYEGTFFLRHTRSGSSYSIIEQRVEDVRAFAGQTVTLSYWAKVASGTITNEPSFAQFFGTGGSSEVATVASNTATITTSWQRFSHTVAIPSISGKTIGTPNYLSVRIIRHISGTGATIDLWGVQLEYGSKATPFQTASGGSPQAELAMCQRYYFRSTPGNAFGNYGLGIAGSATNAYVSLKTPVSMRVIPTSIDVPSTITTLKLTNIAATNWTISAIALSDSTPDNLMLSVTSSGMTANQSLVIGNNNNTAGFIGASAEL
jgi:hypothetical protein